MWHRARQCRRVPVRLLWCQSRCLLRPVLERERQSQRQSLLISTLHLMITSTTTRTLVLSTITSGQLRNGLHAAQAARSVIPSIFVFAVVIAPYSQSSFSCIKNPKQNLQLQKRIVAFYNTDKIRSFYEVPYILLCGWARVFIRDCGRTRWRSRCVVAPWKFPLRVAPIRSCWSLGFLMAGATPLARESFLSTGGAHRVYNSLARKTHHSPNCRVLNRADMNG